MLQQQLLKQQKVIEELQAEIVGKNMHEPTKTYCHNEKEYLNPIGHSRSHDNKYISSRDTSYQQPCMDQNIRNLRQPIDVNYDPYHPHHRKAPLDSRNHEPCYPHHQEPHQANMHSYKPPFTNQNGPTSNHLGGIADLHQAHLNRFQDGDYHQMPSRMDSRKLAAYIAHTNTMSMLVQSNTFLALLGDN